MWLVSVIELRRATDADAEAVADVLIDSYRAALPTVRRAHDDADIRQYVREVLIPRTECWVAVDGNGRPVAMMSLKPGWVDQLYVAPDRLGEGIGRRLLDLAKERSAGELQLWTFQVNDRARRFYGRNGFVAAEMTDGSANEEREPDVRLVWRRGPAGGAAMHHE
jgi:GNAT superfamily N-acetyltransferase